MDPINGAVENEQFNSTTEVDANGGWIVTHYTKTWDVRTNRAQYQDHLDAAKRTLAEAQKVVDDASASVEQFDSAIKVVDVPIVEVPVEATSTPAIK